MSARIINLAWVAMACAGRLVAQELEVIGVSSDEVPANLGCWGYWLDEDGSRVAFCSLADNLVEGDTNDAMDSFVRDRETGTTIRISVSTAGVEGDRDSSIAMISDDGSVVAFDSLARNLVANDTNRDMDVFVRDLGAGITECVSVRPSGVPAQGGGSVRGLSADGTIVLFASSSDQLVPGDRNGLGDLFIRDRAADTTTRVSVGTGGMEAQGSSFYGMISPDGRYVAFQSDAANLDPDDIDDDYDVYLHDRQTGVTVLATRGADGADLPSHTTVRGLSADGRFVFFTALVDAVFPELDDDSGGYFRRDLVTGDIRCLAHQTFVWVLPGWIVGEERSGCA